MVRMMSGGGLKSKVVSHASAPKTEPKARAANVAGVAQQGLATAFRKEPLTSGAGYRPRRCPTREFEGPSILLLKGQGLRELFIGAEAKGPTAQ